VTLTPEQQDLLGAIQRVLEGDRAIDAAWLGGSLGRGAGDAFSDVDVVALVAQAPAAEVGMRYAREAALIAEPALVQPLYGARLLNVVTTDWRRFDISFVEAGELGRFDANRLKPLFNRGDRSPPRGTGEAYHATPETVLPLITEYLRVLGLLVVALGRQEYILGLSGLEILRRLTVDLMLEENGVGPADRGGALHRNPFLTAEQRAELAALPPLSANRASVIETNGAFAAIFLPRARRLAAQIGMTWPKDFEAATRRHLERGLGLEI
jgi:predicted nucleotidyltransferase